MGDERVRAPIYAELRYWSELSRLLGDRRFRSPARREDRRPVLLIPGFMAGDASLTLLAGWLRRRGHHVRTSGIRMNVDCAGSALERLQDRMCDFGEPVVVIGQSRGGTLARALAAQRPGAVAGVVTLGSPVLDPLAVSPAVMHTVRAVAALGDIGVPRVFSTACRDGDCCTEFHELLRVAHAPEVPALAVYSRSDAVVDWRACLDPHAECVEVDGSHSGMAVNTAVYRELERVLDRSEEPAWNR